MKDYSVVFFTDNRDNNCQLLKMLEDHAEVTICSYSSDSWADADFYSNKNTAFIIDDIPDDKDALWIISKLYEDGVFTEVPVLFTSSESMYDFERYGFTSFAHDILPVPFDYDIALKRLKNVSEIRQLKLQIVNLTKIHTKRIMNQANMLREQSVKMQSMNFDLVELLVAAIESRDMESGQHIKRIRYFTKALTSAVASMCPEYGITKEQAELIYYASSVHDIGKIAIPDAIMLKPGRLTPEEFEVMKTHTTRGAMLLGMLDDIGENNIYFKYCQDICRYHHERWDGKGYPCGLVGDETPISAQIVSIADCYDALTSHRPYKTALSHEEAVDLILNGACGAFSPQLLKCFASVIPEFAKIEKELKSDTPVQDSPNTAQEDLKNHQESKAGRLSDCEEAIISSYDIVFEADVKNGYFNVIRGNWDKYFPYVPKNFTEFTAQCIKICHPADAARFSNKVNIDTFNELVAKGRTKTRLEFRVINGGIEYLAVGFIVFKTDDNMKISGLYGAFSIYNDDEILSDIKRGFGVTDGLTGLLMPKRFRMDVDAYIKANPDTKNLLVFIDIDDMSICNNLFGYEYGNTLIKEFAAKLRDIKDKDKIVCKAASDKFMLFVKNITRQSDMVMFIENLHKLLRKPYHTATENGVFTATMGISRYPNDGNNYEKLSKAAEYAASTAKVNGKSAYAFYNVGMRHLAAFADEIDKPVIHTQQHNGHEPKFAPIVDVRTGELVCYDYIPFSTSNDIIAVTTEVYYELNKNAATRKNLSIISVKSLLSILIDLKNQGAQLPPMSVYTMFMPDDMPSIIQEIKVFTEENDCSGIKLCLILPQDFLEGITVRKLKSYSSHLKEMGFTLGLYLIGTRYIHNYCYIEDVFDRYVVTSDFIEHTIATGANGHNLKYAAMTMQNLKGYVNYLTVPTKVTDFEAQMMLQAGACDFSSAGDAVFGTKALLEDYVLRKRKAQKNVAESTKLVKELDPALYYFDMSNSVCVLSTYDFVKNRLSVSPNYKSVFGFDIVKFINDRKKIDLSSITHKDDAEAVMSALSNARISLGQVSFRARFIADERGSKYNTFNITAICAIDETGAPMRLQCNITRESE